MPCCGNSNNGGGNGGIGGDGGSNGILPSSLGLSGKFCNSCLLFWVLIFGVFLILIKANGDNE